MMRNKAAEGQGPVVLIVDDDPIFAAMLTQVLSAQGVKHIQHASDGQKAGAILRAGEPKIDVMTLDLSMPNQDGVAFLRDAKAAGFSGNLVLISGEHASVLASAARLAHILGLNCIGALPKPVDYLGASRLILQQRQETVRISRVEPDRGDMEAILDSGQLQAHYQPKVRLADRRIMGAEALARVSGSDGADIDIQSLVELAERHGRMDRLTAMMVERVVADAVELKRLGQSLRLSFNIPASVLDDLGFADRIAALTQAARLDPADLVLELTESGIESEASATLESITRLRMAGFGVAIDDFGTGVSNLERLQMLPFTELKIDKSFLLRSATDSFSRACVEASVRLARELELTVVAEGVETRTEFAIAREVGADIGQGYYFGRAMPFDRLVSLAQRDGGFIVDPANG